jgi:DNA-binding PadR family transcriptional regulator
LSLSLLLSVSSLVLVVAARLLRCANLISIVEQMSRELLGSFELMVLLALIPLEDEAYGVPIARAIEKSTGREVLLGSVYAALERLEGKGFVVSSIGAPTPERGGRAKRFFRITRSGAQQVRETRNALMKLWRDVPQSEGGLA